MSDSGIKWYSMNLDEQIEEHEAVDLKRAIQIADEYLTRGKEKFESGTEAIAATMFGFSRSKSEFIEFCVNSPKHISCKFEFSNPDAAWFQKLRGGTIQHEERLNSREKLVQKITEFFSDSAEQIAQQYKNRKSGSRRSPLGNPAGASIGVRILTIILFSLLGLFMAYSILQGISDGKICWPGKYSHDLWVYRNRNPGAFWILVIIYAAISFWMIRGSVLEFKIVRRLWERRKELNATTPRN